MSDESSKFKHSKRLLKSTNHINKQVKIAKAHGMPVENPHAYAKRSATTCGDSNCVMCGNPRKFFKEKTIQEKRFEQTALLPDIE
jgi:hypothetical protein